MGRLSLSLAIILLIPIQTGSVPAQALLPQVLTGPWNTEFVDNPTRVFDDLNPRALAFDSAGHPHIVYGGDHLYHAWHNGSSWQIETVDTSWGVGRYASIALNTSTNPNGIHVAYYDARYTNLKYAWKDGSGWHITSPATHGELGQYCSLALDPTSHQPRISYYDAANTNLFCVIGTCSGGSCAWSGTQVDSAADVGQFSSITTETGKVHIAYRDATNLALKYAYWDGSWHTPETAYSCSGCDGGWYASIVIGSGLGRPTIAHYDHNLKKLVLSERSGAVWIDESTTLLDTPSSITLLDAGGAFEVIVSATYNWLRDYVHEAGWASSPITLVSGEFIYGAAAAYGPTYGQVCAAYHAYEAPGSGGFPLRYYCEGSSPVTVDRSGRVGANGNSLALDSEGQPQVAYYDAGYGRPRYAKKQASGAWTAGVLAGEFNAGYGTSLAVDSQGHPHMTYSNSAQQLRYAHQEGATWQIDTVATATWPDAEDGRSSIVLDPSSGQPRIAFTKFPTPLLNYAAYTSTWSISATTGGQGIEPSLALDAGSRPHIACYDSSLGALMHVFCVAPPGMRCTWSSETVISPFQWMNPPSIAFGPSGAQPAIAYYDSANGDLIFTGRVTIGPNSFWFPSTVDSVGDVGRYPSLAFDQLGQPHISYYDSTNGDLKRAWRVGPTWSTQVVDSEGDVGRYSSLRIDPCGFPQVSYYDSTNQALKYATLGNGCHLARLPLIVK